MAAAPLPPNEAERLAELARYRILDTPNEPTFDALAHLAAHLCGTADAYVVLVDRERQWFKSSLGRLGSESARELAFCAHTILGPEPLVVPDARRDPRFSTNPLVTGEPQLRFYAGVPLRSSKGLALGTLCVIDYVPREMSVPQAQALVWLGRQVEAQLELRLRLLGVEETLQGQAAQEALRSEAVRAHLELVTLAVHDLKNPLSAVLANARFILAEPLPEQVLAATRSTLECAELALRQLADLLDVTLAQSGALQVHPWAVDAFALLERVRRGAAQLAQERGVSLTLAPSPAGEVVHTDGDLLRRVLENLLDNALKYVPRGERVQLEVGRDARGRVEFRVRDSGPGIPAADRERIFAALTRLSGPKDGGRRPGGRGLGLYFCHLAVQALGGDIEVQENQPRGTLFLVRLPAQAPTPQ